MNDLPARWRKHRPSAEPKPPRPKLTPGLPRESYIDVKRACESWLSERGVTGAISHSLICTP